jgi:hypothetical protein
MRPLRGRPRRVSARDPPRLEALWVCVCVALTRTRCRPRGAAPQDASCVSDVLGSLCDLAAAGVNVLAAVHQVQIDR